MKESFLQILKKYFSEKRPEEILLKEQKNVVIPIEWIFTEKLDRDIIEKAMAKLLIKSNHSYKNNVISKSRNIDKIRGVSVNIFNDKIDLNVNGIDDWTKAIISERPYEKSKILNFSETEFYQEILNVLKEKGLDDLELSNEEKENLQTIFSNMPMDKLTLDGIKEAMRNAANNLIAYYEYLIKEKEQSEIHNVVIEQRKDKKGPINRKGIKSSARKNPIIPFVDRAKILTNLNCSERINVDEIDEDGNLIPSTYEIFVYKNPIGEEGLLFVAEPLEGTHSTRITYVPKERYDAFKIEEGKRRTEEIAKHYLEMSESEFIKEKNVYQLNHGDIKTFKERLEYIITGGKTPIEKKGDDKKAKINFSNRKSHYNQILNKIYGKKRINSDNIGSMGETALASEVDTIEQMLETKTNDKTKGE